MVSPPKVSMISSLKVTNLKHVFLKIFKFSSLAIVCVNKEPICTIAHHFNKYHYISLPGMFEFIVKMPGRCLVFTLFFERLHEINSTNHCSPVGRIIAISKRSNPNKKR